MPMIDSFEAQKIISQHRGDAIVVATMTGNFEWPQVSDNPALDLPLSGSMGKASSVALGLALARPARKVIVLDGDGSLLMNLGSLITIASQAPPNLIHFVIENRVYRTSGGQSIPHAGKFSFTGLAREAGYAQSYDFDDLDAFRHAIEEIMSRPGPTMVVLHTPPHVERPPYPLTRSKDVIGRFKEAMTRTPN